ncbi:hypothetical protein ACJMK2_004480 [Sinanodonta woodiana]|uniref:Uncharacterized protein n=1 Tax=Sinanodonta woodiana TaxID=1069815 RepID=A0ABD3Y2J3_SINWO
MQNKDRSHGNENRRNNSHNKADEAGYTGNDGQVHKDAIFTALRKVMGKIHKFPSFRSEGGKWRRDLRDGLNAFSKQIDAFENLDHLAYGVIQSYMREAGRLVLSSNTLHIVCSVVNVGWSIYYKVDGIHIDPDNFAVIKLSLKIIVSFFYSSDEVKCDMAKDEDFLKTLTKILKTCYNSDNRKLEKVFS